MGVRRAEETTGRVRRVDGPKRPLDRGQRGGGVRQAQDHSPLDAVPFFFQGANEVISSPFRIAEMGITKGLKAAGLMSEDNRGEYISDALGLTAEPQTPGQRMAQSGGREVVNTLPAIVPQYRVAQTGIGALEKALPNVADRVRQSLISQVTTKPASTAAAEVAGATGAGIGAQAGREAFPGNPLAETGGAIIGGGGVPLAADLALRTPSAALFRAGKRVYDGNFSPEAGRRGVGEALAGSIDDRAATNIRESERVMDNLGVLERPSVAEASNSPNLLRNQRAIESEASGDALNMLTWRKREAADQIINNQVRPEFTGKEPSVIYSASRARAETVANRVATSQQQVAGAQQDLATQLAPVDRTRVGRALRETRAQARREVADGYEQRANAEGINDGSVMFDFNDFRESVRDTFFNPRSRFAERSKSPILRRIAGLPPESADLPRTQPKPAAVEVEPAQARPVTFEDLKAIRQEVGDEIATANATGDKARARELISFQKMFDDYFETVDPSVGNPELVQNWRAFRADYKRDVIDRFDKGAAYEIGRKGRRREFVMHDEAVAGSFLESETTARQFNQLYRNNPEATVAMRAAILDEARVAAVRDGRIDRNAMDAYLRRRERVLAEFPEIKQELEGISSSARALSAREDALTNRARVIAKSELSKALDQPLDDLLPRALRNPVLMREVANTARRTGNQDALTASIWEQAIGQLDPSNPLPDPKQLLNWITMNERTLRMALPADHLRAIRDVYSGLEIIGRTPLPQGAPQAIGALDKAEQFAGTSVSQMASRVFAAESGRVSYRYNAVDALARFANRMTKRQFNKVMAQALFDPALAKELADMKRVEAITPAMTRRMNAWLFNAGLPNLEEENGD